MSSKTLVGLSNPLTIRYGLSSCSLGQFLVGLSSRGICALHLGSHADALQKELQEQFRQATWIADPTTILPMLPQMIECIENPTQAVDLPLDLMGTDFQIRVWQALRQIPAGTLVTYQHIAESIGAPRSVRAVGQACAANPIAILVPCHRVVRSDSTLGGYRWGISIKQKLLRREGILSESSIV